MKLVDYDVERSITLTGGNWSTAFTFKMKGSNGAFRPIRITLAVKSMIVDPFCIEIEVFEVF